MQLKYEHLLGIPYEAGKHDCFSLCRQFYIDNFDIEVTNYARPHDWDANKIDIMGIAHEREGFQKVYDWSIKTLRPGDILCMAVGTANANHFALYLGANEIIHHKTGHVSNKETLRDFWRMSTLYVLRHPQVPDLTVELPSVTIKELNDARYARVVSAA